MRIMGRAVSGLAVAALAASVSLLGAGAAHATSWDSGCGSRAYEAQIYSPTAGDFCYYGTGPGWADVYNVTSLYAGEYTASFNTSVGTQYFSPYHGASYGGIHAGTFYLS